MFYTSATQKTTTVLLKIAVVTFDKNQVEADILFDEGAQHSKVLAILTELQYGLEQTTEKSYLSKS